MQTRLFKNRKSIRLTGYDYSQNGLYFITICTKNRECILGEIINGKMILSEFGQIAKILANIKNIWANDDSPLLFYYLCIEKF